MQLAPPKSASTLYNKTPKLFEDFCEFKDLNGIAESFAKNGFVKIKGAFKPQEIEVIRNNIVRYQKEVAPNVDECDRFQPAMADGVYSILGRMDIYDSFFKSLVSDPRFQQIGKMLLSDTATSSHIQFFNIIPGFSPPTPPHQDAFNFRSLKGAMINIWVPLSKVDASNGCLHYIPESHLAGPRHHHAYNSKGPDIVCPYTKKDTLSEVAVHAELGDILVHHGLTIHGSEENLSKHQRWALGFPYLGKFIPVSKEMWLAESKSVSDLRQFNGH